MPRNPIKTFTQDELVRTSLLGEKKYKKFLKQTKELIKTKGYKVKDGGFLLLEATLPTGEVRSLGLQNLERKLVDVPQSKWAERIGEYLAVLDHRLDLKELAKKHKDRFKKLLRLKLYRSDDNVKFLNSAIHKEIMPGLHWVVTVDADTYTVTVNKDVADIAKLTPEELFDLGMSNTATSSPVLSQDIMDGNDRIKIFSGDDFVTANILDITKGWEELRFGKIVALPTKHLMLSLDITDMLVEDLNTFITAVLAMFHQEIGPLTPDLYWYKDGEFSLMTIDIHDSRIMFNPTKEFIDEVLATFANLTPTN